MDTIGDFIWLNVWLLLALAALGALAGAMLGKAGAAVGAFYALAVGVGLSFWGWVIYIVIHFVKKRW